MAALIAVLSGFALLLSAPFGKSSIGKKLRRFALGSLVTAVVLALVAPFVEVAIRNAARSVQSIPSAICLMAISLLAYAVLEGRRRIRRRDAKAPFLDLRKSGKAPPRARTDEGNLP